MTHQHVSRTNQQSKSDTPLASGILQRAAVRAVAGEEVEATQEAESGRLSQSRFVHDFSQVPINRGGLPKEVSKTPNQTGLPDNLKAGVENLSGYSLDNVRVHYNSPKPTQLQALAYTQGTDIHVAPGQEKHLPHEVWHVVQQMQGRAKPTMQMKGVEINDNEELEREADVMGVKLLVNKENNIGLPVQKAILIAQPIKANKYPLQFQLNRRTLIDHTKPSWRIDEAFRQNLLNIIDKYNKKEERLNHTKQNIHKNLETLDTIEHLLYRWFDENKKDVDNKNRYGLFLLLNEIQENHKFWVSVNVKEGHAMWTKDKLDDEQQEEMNAIWEDIVNGSGAFNIRNQVHTVDGMKDLPASVLEKFKVEVFASLARLYSRPKGRDLLKALNDGFADEKTIAFVMSPLYKILGTEGYAETPYVGAKATATNETAARIKLKGLKKKNRKVVSGKGSGAGVEIAPGVKDASMIDFDEDDNAILSPNFIGIGHELIHAAHYGAGTYIGVRPQVGAPHAQIPGDYENDVEEFMTIASHKEKAKAENTKVTTTLDKVSEGSQKHTFKLSELEKLNTGIPTEAEIREEHGLSIRHGHTSSANPAMYRDVKKGDDPGRFVSDSIKWITPHLQEITPPPPVRAVARDGRAEREVVVDERISTFLKGIGIIALVGSSIAVSLLWKYGFPFRTDEV